MYALIDHHIKGFIKLVYACCLCVLVLGLTGCASVEKPIPHANSPWYQQILDYENTLNPEHPDRIENLLEIDVDILQLIKTQFTDKDEHTRSKKLANWLVAKDGHQMIYDIEANLSPAQAFMQQRGNCLSFTILLVSLAKAIDVELKYNDVDLPGEWSMDERAGMIFYQHINAKSQKYQTTQIFDLAIEDYEIRYPQRTISERNAVAHLHGNLGIDALKQDRIEDVFHHLKLATSMAPNDPDMWVNLGAAYKRYKYYEESEKAFKIALSISDKNSLAASNLERLYRLLGRENLAKKYNKISQRARLYNPYSQYQKAKKKLAEKKFKQAKKAIRRAIRLHDSDPTFYELSSIINQQLKNPVDAVFDLDKAVQLSVDQVERKRYASKAEVIFKLIEAQAKKNKRPPPTIIQPPYETVF